MVLPDRIELSTSRLPMGRLHDLKSHVLQSIRHNVAILRGQLGGLELLRRGRCTSRKSDRMAERTQKDGLGACLRSLCSIGDDSDSRWVDEQVFSALED